MVGKTLRARHFDERPDATRLQCLQARDRKVRGRQRERRRHADQVYERLLESHLGDQLPEDGAFRSQARDQVFDGRHEAIMAHPVRGQRDGTGVSQRDPVPGGPGHGPTAYTSPDAGGCGKPACSAGSTSDPQGSQDSFDARTVSIEVNQQQTNHETQFAQ
jgi:hypothetical protein